MDNSPLLNLPPELRNDIYELVLSVPDTIYAYEQLWGNTMHGVIPPDMNHMMQVVIQSDVKLMRPAGTGRLALLATCKQIHEESAKFFYACNKFEINVPRESTSAEAMSTLYRFASKLGPANTKVLNKVPTFLDPRCVATLDGAEGKAPLEIFRRLHSEHIANPQWNLKAKLLLILPRDGRDGRQLDHTVTIDISEVEAALIRVSQNWSRRRRASLPGTSMMRT